MNKEKQEVIGSYIPPDDAGKGEEIDRGYFRQGWVYKNPNAFYNEPDAVCYIPELSDTKYTRKDFLGMCSEQEDMAKELFDSVDWQHPETLIEDWMVNGEWDVCKKCEKIFDSYGVEECPHCGAKVEREE